MIENRWIIVSKQPEEKVREFLKDSIEIEAVVNNIELVKDKSNILYLDSITNLKEEYFDKDIYFLETKDDKITGVISISDLLQSKLYLLNA